MSFGKKLVEFLAGGTVEEKVEETKQKLSNDPIIQGSLDRIAELDKEIEADIEKKRKNDPEFKYEFDKGNILWSDDGLVTLEYKDRHKRLLGDIAWKSTQDGKYHNYLSYNEKKYGSYLEYDVLCGKHDEDINKKIIDILKRKKMKLSAKDLYTFATSKKSLKKDPYFKWVCIDRFKDHLTYLWQEEEIEKTGNHKYYLED
jgi:hypothetical protein